MQGIPNESREKSVITLLDGVETNQTSPVIPFGSGRKWAQVNIIGTGTVSATVEFYGNNVSSNLNGVLLATTGDTLSGTNSDVAGADIPGEPAYIYCVLSAITGTNAAVTVTIGI